MRLSLGFHGLDFFDSTLMTPTIEAGREKDSNQVIDGPIAYQIAWQAQDIHIVMSSACLDHDLVRACRRANAAEFVRRNGHSNTGAANQDTPLGDPFGNEPTDLVRKVWIVDSGITGRSTIVNGVIFIGKQLHQFVLDLKTTMITADCDMHETTYLMPKRVIGRSPFSVEICFEVGCYCAEGCDLPQ
jgi:hypothetical protein